MRLWLPFEFPPLCGDCMTLLDNDTVSVSLSGLNLILMRDNSVSQSVWLWFPRVNVVVTDDGINHNWGLGRILSLDSALHH